MKTIMNPRKLLLSILIFAGTVSYAQNELLTEHIDKVYEQSDVRCIYTFDFPVSSEGALNEAVMSLMQIDSEDSGIPSNWRIKDIRSLEEAIKADADSVLSNMDESLGPWTRIVEVSKISEGNKYVCYKDFYYESDASMYPVTKTFVIRKSDGKFIDVLKNGDSKDFYKLLSKNFNSYLYENFGQDNKDYLAEDIKERPEILGFNSEDMDFCWIDDNYLYIGYGQTSVARVVGVQTLRIPLNDVKQYLTKEIKALL